MLFTSPLAKSMKNLSKLRPTASIPGSNTMWSTCGTHTISFALLVIALAIYFAQDCFQCRYWGSNYVSDPDIIGNDYETSVIFIVSGYQYILLAAAFNFGYSFRQNWFCSYVFVFLFLLFTAIQFGMTLYLPDLAIKLLTVFFHVGEVYFITTMYMIAKGLKSYLESSHEEYLALYYRNRLLSSKGNCAKATTRP